ncbi:hypothetical protein [Coxiella burnetii]|uniref:hypothetical protein n=1 Tax=Coxiella burnetii TaxID=777 RepID=UPI000163A54F|nr:hypothetical protein [Coxiella burnetii]ATN85343.1 hypothetical protein AYO29_01915 [Coxiella burnetii str. Schperling]EDR35161.1 hypothetical protein COXBURSA334_0751 [Coxiella burnetii Q321]
MDKGYHKTVGGIGGHILRRFIHLSMLIIPFLYYSYAKSRFNLFGLSYKSLLLVIIGLMLLFEIVRLKRGWLLWGQREREGKNFSSLAWTIVSLCLVLLLAPGKQYAIPIIWSCAIVDPLLGELRRTQLSRTWIVFIGIVVVMIIWGLASWWFKLDWLLVLLMGPLVVILEWPNFRWLDDNALVQLVPLLVILILYG